MQDFKKKYGLDYLETFSPIKKFQTIRLLLTIALHSIWPILYLDVANAFLHVELSETIHLSQPQGFQDPQHPNHICLLKKVLYSLKQAPLQWFATLSSYLINHDSHFSHC